MDMNQLVLSGVVNSEITINNFKTLTVAEFELLFKKSTKTKDMGWKDEQSEFCVKGFQTTAEYMSGLKAGDYVCIFGSIKLEQWKNKNGELKKRMVVVANKILKETPPETIAVEEEIVDKPETIKDEELPF